MDSLTPVSELRIFLHRVRASTEQLLAVATEDRGSGGNDRERSSVV